MTTSDTYNFNLSNADIVLEAFDRCGIRPTSLTRQHMQSAVRSVNLALQTWGNRGVNLWAVDLQTIPMQQGVTTYTLPSDTVSLLDAYREQYQLSNLVNLTPSFSTISGQSIVNVLQSNHGLQTGFWLQAVLPVAVGGIILFGFYMVTNVTDQNNYTLGTYSPALSTVTNTGVVPLFSTSPASDVITVVLPNHGLGVGQTFNIQIQTQVSNIILLGAYNVATVVDSNTFTFIGPYQAQSSDSVYENSGQAQLNTQTTSSQPNDQSMVSISRSEYASYPNKDIQGTPTVFWFDRLSPIPTVTVWQPPDQNGPYAFKYYRMRRVQDAAAAMGQTADIPYLFLDALCADVANRLARKYAPAIVQALTMEAKMAWDEAMAENREYVDIMVQCDLSSYWRI